MIVLAYLAIFLTIFRGTFGSPEEDRLHFSDRRAPEDEEGRSFRRRPYSEDRPSKIENVFKIPIAVIKGTSAAAQAISPENSETIDKIFDIPVSTLDAVGNYIKESRPQRPVNEDIYDEVDDDDGDDFVVQRPLTSDDRRRRDKERRDRIIKLREEERERRRLAEQERFFLLGHHSSHGLFSSFVDLFSTDLFGGHGHGHGHGFPTKPPKRPHKPLRPQKPLKPQKPFRPQKPSRPQKPENFESNGGYEVHEQVDDDVPLQSTGIFSWLQTTNSRPRDDRIQNKIAPGFEYRNSPDHVQFRSR